MHRKHEEETGKLAADGILTSGPGNDVGTEEVMADEKRKEADFKRIQGKAECSKLS